MPRMITPVGTVSYNGYTFPAPLKSRVTATPIYDGADRTIKYITYSLSVETLVFPDDPPQSTANAVISLNLEDIRVKLQQAGGALVFTSQGFGNFQINVTSVQDIKYGPKPRLLLWEPLGSNKAVRIVWTCETTIPECSASTAYNTFLAGFEYEVAWQISEDGMTNRRISGQLEIPVRFSGNILSDTVDRVRSNLLNIPSVPGFHRSYPEIATSKDKSILTFSLVDREIPSPDPYFPGMINMDVDFRVRSSLQQGAFHKWFANLDGRIEVAPDVGKEFAWQAFTIIANKKLAAALAGPPVVVQNPAGDPVTHQPSVIPLEFSIGEEVFGRTVNFSIRYWFWSTPEGLLGTSGSSGLFQSVAENSWSTWNSSLINVAHNPRGFSQLAHFANDDTQVSLCNTNVPGINGSTVPGFPTGTAAILHTPCPSASRSWAEYQNEVEILCQGKSIFTTRLEATDVTEHQDPALSPNPADTGFKLPSNFSPGSDSGTLHARGYPVYKAILTGHAIRVGFTIPAPTLVSVGGANAFLVNDTKRIKHRLARASKDCPVYVARWRLEYTLGTQPVGDMSVSINTNGGPEFFQ